jgi:probable HAF family extracellular repeat protein
VAGINNLGVIVGFYVDSNGNFHGFELSPGR